MAVIHKFKHNKKRIKHVSYRRNNGENLYLAIGLDYRNEIKIKRFNSIHSMEQSNLNVMYYTSIDLSPAIEIMELELNLYNKVTKAQLEKDQDSNREYLYLAKAISGERGNTGIGIYKYNSIESLIRSTGVIILGYISLDITHVYNALWKKVEDKYV